jgi:hypothetical protein
MQIIVAPGHHSCCDSFRQESDRDYARSCWRGLTQVRAGSRIGANEASRTTQRIPTRQPRASGER